MKTDTKELIEYMLKSKYLKIEFPLYEQVLNRACAEQILKAWMKDTKQK